MTGTETGAVTMMITPNINAYCAIRPQAPEELMVDFPKLYKINIGQFKDMHNSARDRAIVVITNEQDKDRIYTYAIFLIKVSDEQMLEILLKSETDRVGIDNSQCVKAIDDMYRKGAIDGKRMPSILKYAQTRSKQKKASTSRTSSSFTGNEAFMYMGMHLPMMQPRLDPFWHDGFSTTFGSK